MSNQQTTGADWKTKGEIAGHYQIGIRTVTKLLRRRILPFCRLRHLVRFELAECDRAFECFCVPSLLKGLEGRRLDGSRKRCWRTKRQIAEHLRISERTVTTLMRQRVLPYVKLGRLVRLDEVACDSAMECFRTRCIQDRIRPRAEP